MGSIETGTELDCSVRVDTVTVAVTVDSERFVSPLDAVGDGGCVSGIVDDNGGSTGIESRNGTGFPECPVNCLSGNGCHSYGCGETGDGCLGYHPPFRTDSFDFTDSENYRGTCSIDGVNEVVCGFKGQVEKKEFGVLGFCSNDSDVENRSIDGNGLENPYVDGELQSTSPGSSGITCIVSNERKEADTDCLDDPYLAGCQGDGEEKGHGSSGISSELPTGENVDGLLKGSPEIASYDLAEGSATPLSRFFGVAGSSCSKYLCVSNNYERCGVSGLTCCSSSIGGSFGLKSDDGRSLFECSTMLEANDANVGPSSSSMITRASKSNRLTRTRRAAWQCSQTVASSSGLGNTLWATSNKIRGKRSSFCKPARLSIWGELGSLVQIFDQNSSIPKFTLSNSCHDIGLLGRQSKVINNRGSAKKRGGVGRRTSKKTKVGGSFKKLKRRASTNWQRSKVRMEGHWGKKGSRSLCPEVDSLDGTGLKPVDAGSLSSLVENPIHVGIGSYSKLEIECKHNDIKNPLCEPDCQLNLEGSESAREVAHKLEADGCAIEQVDQLVVSMPAEEFKYSLDGNSGRPIMALDVSVLDSPHEDKDMESTVTLEALTEYTLGDCQDISPPASIEASKEAIVNKELELGLFPALEGFSLFPEKAAIVGEVTVSTYQKSRARKGKKDEKAKADPHILAGAFPLGQKIVDPVSLEKSGKPAKSRTVKNARNTKGLKAALKSSASKNDSGKAPGSEGFSMETSLSDITDVRVTRENVNLEMALEAPALSGQGPFGIMLSAAAVLDGLLPMRKRKGPTLQKKTTTASRKSRSHGPDSAESRKANARGKKKENMDNKVSKREVEEKEILHEFHFKDKSHTHNISSCFETGMCSEPRKFIELSENDLVAKDALQEMGVLRGSKEVSCEGMSASVMVEGGDNLASSKSGEGSDVQCLPPRVAWVLCDDCQKWRCIPAELADIIGETDCRWTCKDNTDKTFADCSIPQEKSNAEINAELNISDEDSCSVLPYFKGSESKQSTSSQQASWTLIKSNLFLHRSRRTQTIDEIMVCQCKPPLGGSMGCGDECLNRILNIECVRGTCPCGDFCSNQQFQRHKYANFKWFRCEKKGYGLKLQEDVSEGAFLIEYVGEVLDLHAYEARQHDYASKGQRHFYFMTLNGSEVIDACAKGNLGRFINHSCDPNCRTEKWMVNGEVCIGLFALRDIQKGEEVTFDYNYVRVFGAAAKKCVCGSSECRGYIGGDPSSTEVVRVDSDDDYPESIMIHEDGRIEHLVEEKILDSSLLDVVAVPQGDHLDEKKVSDSGVLDVALPQREHFEDAAIADASFPVPVTIPQEEHFEEEKIPDTSLSDFDVPHGEICLQTTQIKSQTLSDTVEDNLTILKPCPSHMKSPCVSSSIKKSRCINSKIKAIKPKKLVAGSESSHSDGVDAKLTDVKFTKHKKIVAGAESSRIEGVEEKLNEVLDAEGGISKRKDATKGYLKLLLVTAASGDNIKGEAFQSTRDLSIVLDALLKTKSRMVLVDIVNKNGLQMLHNMIKQNRRNFNKTPIIRKLLKVLAFLAVKEILTLEQINAGPPCPGMESFRDSIFILTRHNDTQVQHMARSFRDKWMPRSFRKLNVSDREDAEFSHRSGGHWKEFSASHKYWQGRSACHTNATNSLTQKLPTITPLDADSPTSQTSPSPTLHGSSAISTTDGNPTDVPKQRKRKSRWDQPTEVATGAESEPQQNTKRLIIERSSSQVEPSIRVPEGCEVSQNQIMMVQREENDCSGFNGHSLHTSIQPLLNADITNRVPYFPSPACNEVVMGQTQVKFLPNLPVSYGIPLPLVQQLGTYHQGAGGDGRSSPGWAIAPAVPFHPFPPLPPLPPPSQQSSTMLPSQRKHGEEAQADNCARNHHMESATPTVSGTTASETVAFNSTRSSQSHERGKWSSGGLGRRSFRQQKWSPQGYPKTPPWVWHQNGWTSRGNWKHGGFSCAGNATNKMGSMDQGDNSFRRTTGGAGWRPSDDRGAKNIGDDY